MESAARGCTNQDWNNVRSTGAIVEHFGLQARDYLCVCVCVCVCVRARARIDSSTQMAMGFECVNNSLSRNVCVGGDASSLVPIIQVKQLDHLNRFWHAVERHEDGLY